MCGFHSRIFDDAFPRGFPTGPSHEAFPQGCPTCHRGGSRYFWSLPRGVSPRLQWGHARVLSSRAVAALSRFPSPGSRDLWLSLEVFPGGLPTGLFYLPPQWESILDVKVRQCRENRFLWNGLRILGDSWIGGTMLEFLSRFLWRAPPLEMGRECPEYFPNQAGKGSLISSYDAETGLLWMWTGPSCFL